MLAAPELMTTAATSTPSPSTKSAAERHSLRIAYVRGLIERDCADQLGVVSVELTLDLLEQALLMLRERHPALLPRQIIGPNGRSSQNRTLVGRTVVTSSGQGDIFPPETQIRHIRGGIVVIPALYRHQGPEGERPEGERPGRDPPGGSTSVAGCTDPDPNRAAARSTARSASRQPDSRSPIISCRVALPDATRLSARMPTRA